MKNVNSGNPEFYFLRFSYVEFPLNPLSRWYVDSYDFDEFFTTADPTKKYELFIYFLIDLRNSNETDVIVFRYWNTDAIVMGIGTDELFNSKNEMDFELWWNEVASDFAYMCFLILRNYLAGKEIFSNVQAGVQLPMMLFFFGGGVANTVSLACYIINQSRGTILPHWQIKLTVDQ